jgi:hypothetical protein
VAWGSWPLMNWCFWVTWKPFLSFLSGEPCEGGCCYYMLYGDKIGCVVVG